MDKTWLDKLCGPLEHPKYPQIYRSLVKFDKDNQIIGKCVEGEIACQNNIIYDNDQPTLTREQLLQLGIPEDLVNGKILPMIWTNMEVDFNEDNTSSIGTYIWKLNDVGYTYDTIVEFLRTTFGDAV